MKGKNLPSGKKGAVLITVIMILFFLAILGMSMSAFVFSRISYSQLQFDRLSALYLSEAGIAVAIYELRTDKDIDGNGAGNSMPTKLGRGTYKTRHNFQTSTITSTGEVNKTKRTLQIKYSTI